MKLIQIIKINKMSGYIFGVILSVVAFVSIILYLSLQGLGYVTSLGGAPSLSIKEITVYVGGYLLIAALLALGSFYYFRANLIIAFLLNLTPPVILVSLVYFLSEYNESTRRQDYAHLAQNAVEDATYIQLEKPFVKIVESSTGGSPILYLHVPFTVTKNLRNKSILILIPNLFPADIKYSSNPNPDCSKISYKVPSNGFYIVEQEYTESLEPLYISGKLTEINTLEPNKRYYLFRELHFNSFNCKAKDYKDFDTQQLDIKIDAAEAERIIRDNSPKPFWSRRGN